MKKLYKLKVPEITEVNYQDIEKYVLPNQSELESFDYWITYFHKSTHYNFFYFEFNNFSNLSSKSSGQSLL